MDLAFEFGAPAAGLHRCAGSMTIALPNAVLAGTGSELWAVGIDRIRDCRGVTLWQCGPDTWGLGAVEVDDQGFQGAAETLYRDMFHVTRALSLQRIWNFVPRINAVDHELENYRAFCQGRYRAFDACSGGDSERRMPAASAVGTTGNRLCAVFIAGPGTVRYVENPHQVPAYRYPSRYGPKAPSFARASVLEGAEGRRLYVSGTASIRGSDSLHPGDVSAQLELAIDNMDAVARAAGFDAGLTRDSAGERRWRLYLRHPEDWDAARHVLLRRLYRQDDQLTALQADICRPELLVEIEACVDVPPERITADAGTPVTY
jgi:enamine deaminase RidA (YjgF/YER057c/UK114 family)